MDIARFGRHLFAGSAARLYPAASLQRIGDAIADGERRHRGQVVFAVESALALPAVLAGRQARERAADVFAQLRVWDTADNNGVLIYLLVADRRIEIVADRALAARITETQWRAVCQQIEEQLRAGQPEAAALAGIAAVSDMLAEHFPRAAGDASINELSDRPHLL